MLSSASYKKWHADAISQILAQKILESDMHITRVGRMYFTIFAPDARKFDLSNKFESIADLLVDAGILADDNYEVLPWVVLQFGGIDRKNPRAEILIS